MVGHLLEGILEDVYVDPRAIVRNQREETTPNMIPGREARGIEATEEGGDEKKAFPVGTRHTGGRMTERGSIHAT